MAEKKDNKEKKEQAKKTRSKKAKNTTKKSEDKKVVKKSVSKKTNIKDKKAEEKVADVYASKRKKEKKESRLKKWFNNLTLEQLIIGGVVIIAILLIILICVSTKNTKTNDGDDIVIKLDGLTITADDLYKELKQQGGQTVAINMVDEYILNQEYETTEEMEESAEATIENYKSTYGDSYESFLEYNGISDDEELKELLIMNTKISYATDDYVEDNLTDDEMEEYYENEIVGDISAKHILISYEEDDSLTDEENEANEEAALAKAEEVIKKLQNGEDFDELAKEYSDDESTKDDGGDLGYFNTGEMVEEFEQAAYALDVDEYTTEPVKTEYGYHIIMKTGQKEKPSFDTVKETIIENLIEQKEEEDSNLSIKAMVALREKYNMQIKDKTIKSDYNTYVKEATTTE